MRESLRPARRIVFAIAVAYGVFQVVVGITAPLPELMLRATHLFFAFVLVFIYYPIVFCVGDRGKHTSAIVPFVVGGIGGTLLVMIAVQATSTYLGVTGVSLPNYAWLVIGLATAAGLYVLGKRMAARNLMVPMDIVLEILAITVSAYVVVSYERIMGFMVTAVPMDYLISASLIFLVVEGGRRVVGWTLPILIGALTTYVLFGQYLPGYFGHPVITGRHVLGSLLLDPATGSYGYLVGLSASIIGILVIWGGLILSTGFGQSLMSLTIAAFGGKVGGPAKVAVVSSSLFGTVSGAAVANVAVTGNFTIPLMRSCGYKPAFAAGTEATASTGGQIMPPIMGIGAFIMAELLGISYLKVIVAAILPAVLYYVGCFASVHFQAKRGELPPIPSEQLLTLRAALAYWRPLVSLGIAVVVLLGMVARGYSLSLSVSGAVAVTIILHLLVGGGLRLFPRRGLSIVEGMERGGRMLAGMAVIIVLAQLAVNLVGMCGLAPKVTDLISSLGGGNLFLGLVFAGVSCIVLGMGMPTTAAYVLGVGLILPALSAFGLPPIVAHMFIFYYCVMSAITPPVCAAVYVASTMAGVGWLRTAEWALRLGYAGLIVPLIFAYRHGLLLMGGPLAVLLSATIATVAVFAWAAGLAGFLDRPLGKVERALLWAGGAMLFIPVRLFDILGGLIVIGVFVWQRFLRPMRPRYGQGR